MKKEEMTAIKQIIKASNTLTAAWGCGPAAIVVKHSILNPGNYGVTIECPTSYYAIYVAGFLSLVSSHLPRVNENKITIE